MRGHTIAPLSFRLRIHEVRSVLDKLDFLVRFWELRARHAEQGEPLSPLEQRELLSLMQLVQGDHTPRPGSVPPPRPSTVAARLLGPGLSEAATLARVTASAIVVRVDGAEAPALGASVVLHITDAIRGVEYALPCRVAWVQGAREKSVALAVDGMPERALFGRFGREGASRALFRAPGPRPRAPRLAS